MYEIINKLLKAKKMNILLTIIKMEPISNLVLILNKF